MQTIERDELKQHLDESQDFLFLNVLSEEKYEDEHIPGSQNVPFDDDDEDFARKVEPLVATKDDFIVVYCASTDCPASSNAAKALENAGFTNVRAYEGGIHDWKDASYKLEGEKVQSKTRAR